MYVLKKLHGRAWTGLTFHRVRKYSNYCESGDKTSGSIKHGNFLYYLRNCSRRTRLSELN
jgi:hypothetical protein